MKSIESPLFSVAVTLAIGWSCVSALRVETEPPAEVKAPDNSLFAVVLRRSNAVIKNSNTYSNDVWAFLTTTQDRVESIASVLGSLANQTHIPSHVTVLAGDVETNAALESLIPSIISDGGYEVIGKSLVTDIGPGTKYPSGQVLDQIPQNASIFIGDDDKLYDPRLIEVLIQEQRANPGAAQGYFVRMTGDHPPGYNTHCESVRLSFPLAYAAQGLLFRKPMLEGLQAFCQAVMAFEPACKFVDDMYVSGYLYRSGISVSPGLNLKYPHIRNRDWGGTTHALRFEHDRGCETLRCHNAVQAVDYQFPHGP